MITFTMADGYNGHTVIVDADKIIEIDLRNSLYRLPVVNHTYHTRWIRIDEYNKRYAAAKAANNV